MELFANTFENRKQKIAWGFFVLILFLRFVNPPLLVRNPTLNEYLQSIEIGAINSGISYRPNAFAYWSINFFGFVVFSFVLLLIFIFVSYLLRNKR